ncbi:hypothetical protein COCSUDRAFT_32123 [Coccomyxa subellipsoidea C-169]|uniref:Uncharacterized protein n=1 Tax=Coccomyxa subellipsoidea (strain C-169) TaxID=574566 RepID=I0Z6K4_COCSC|nr:hypothetical protein COCSUDRAFT_32123 [Coccomyxa subellipsoidea C-169]EIE26273.1 hypothetical protein COCSUDRAFT_32123 [Coccomyxa subellipsoidea C-169]|eukprot:XP_005650817.1 hypothetical protein COCSUDRAFT_32123 [Coccomyxa subellipsoidea C-169]
MWLRRGTWRLSRPGMFSNRRRASRHGGHSAQHASCNKLSPAKYLARMQGGTSCPPRWQCWRAPSHATGSPGPGFLGNKPLKARHRISPIALKLSQCAELHLKQPQAPRKAGQSQQAS